MDDHRCPDIGCFSCSILCSMRIKSNQSKRGLQNLSERKISLLASLATAAIRLLTRVCSCRRRTDWQAQLASPGEKPSKSSIFLIARVLQFPQRKKIYETIDNR